MSTSRLLNTHELTFETPGPSTKADGIETPGTPEKETFRCNVQPITGRELEALNKGDRKRRHILITMFAQDGEIRVPTINTRTSFDGDTFEVQTVERWYNHSETVARAL